MLKRLFTRVLLVVFCVQAAVVAQAQFGGAGGGFGPREGQKETKIPGTATDNTPKGTAKIIGFVIDSAATSAVEYATIGLFDKATNKPVSGASADDKGKFTINRLGAGTYKLIVSFIGFKSLTLPEIVLTKGQTLDLGVLRLAQSAKALDEVTITGQRALIEDKVDRIVYNAEKDETSRGGDATDVLKKVPMLSVDLDGNVSLRGNSNIKVLINNKPSSIMASSVADAMKQIPADMIKSVEVITSPSAKYDAEGSSGIVNIITKKNTLQGLTLSIDNSVGLRGSNLGLNGNYRKGKVGLSLGGFGRFNYNTNGAFDNTQTTLSADGSSFTNQQTAETRNTSSFGSYRIGLDYDINKRNTLTGGFRLGARNAFVYQDFLQNNQFRNGNQVAKNTRNVETNDQSTNFDLNLDYTHTFAKPQQEFSVLTQISRNNRNNDFRNFLLDPTNLDLVRGGIRNDNISNNTEVTLQADYQVPLNKKHIFETGLKSIIRLVQSDFTNYVSADGINYIARTGATQNNVFDYDQNVYGAYTSLTTKYNKKYSSKVGVRYEQTSILANLKEGNNSFDIPSYGILVPSFTVSRTLKGGNQVKASYNRRIQRPSLQYLNPNINASNPLNISYGNPSLDPEFTNNFELQSNVFVKNVFLNASLFYRNTNNAIESLKDVVGKDTIRTTYANIGQQDAYGFNLFGNINVKKFMFGGGGDVFYTVLSNQVSNPIFAAQNEGWVMSGRMFASYNLTKTWGLQSFFFYRGNQVQLQGKQGNIAIYSLSVKKDFKDKKGSIGFGAENFFATEFKIRSETKSPIITQNQINTLRNMNFKINFSYRIGKMSFDQPTKRKKSVNNDDLKDGGGSSDSGNSGGGAPSGGGRGSR
jgi:outer membrane receptor protein involved in Fe transport